MIKTLITSSVLILAILILRRVFRGTLSRRAQYALWGLVLARLLVPVNLPAADFSLLTAARPVERTVIERVTSRPVYLPVARAPLELHPAALSAQPDDAGIPEGDSVWLTSDGETAVEYRHISAERILTVIWWAGMAAVGGFFLWSNLSFYLRLRRCRRPFAPPESVSRRVYVVSDRAIPSPCLFGNAIYLTASVAGDNSRRGFVLRHEETHARHLDPLWSLLRCVCLIVYWFDPLVWAASACAQTDCELACDEGVLAGLSEEERISYGRTLLSLIPVKRGGGAFLTATSMTAGKRQLRERFTRIARHPRQLLAAALAAALLAGILAACTFTDGTTWGKDGDASESYVRALNAEELQYFNLDFFNSPADGYGDIRNQFANPLNIYGRPEDIDLFELFYCAGGESFSREELTAALGPEAGVECAAYKLSTGSMDKVLTENLGLTLDKTAKVGLDNFAYLEEYDAYYWEHGDTNFPGTLTFLCGTQEGDTVSLYQNSDFLPGWYCVTLKETEDGWHFLSNEPCDRPRIPTSYPAGDPESIIFFSPLEPYAPPALECDPAGDYTGEDIREGRSVGGHSVVLLLNDAGEGAAAMREGDKLRVFLTGLGGEAGLGSYRDVLGHSGFYVSHTGELSPGSFGTFYDYFYLTDSGEPVLLARTSNSFYEPRALDLDGDGTDELATETEIFFLRDGSVFRADLPSLVEDGYPAFSYWDTSCWDDLSRCLVIHGLDTDGRSIVRYLYFNGGSLFLYRIEKEYQNHMVYRADRGIPAPVADAAKSYVENEVLDNVSGGVWRIKGDGDGEEFDDWRIDYFQPLCDERRGDLRVVGYAFNYELHTTTPDRILLAGGRYMDEDDWVSPAYPGCDCLFFSVDGDDYTLIRHDMINDMTPDSPAFANYVEELMSGLENLG